MLAAVVAVTLVTGSVVAFASPVGASPGWSITPTPNLSSARTAELLAVSCPSAQSCFAVGYWLRPNSSAKQLLERWNGTNWSVMGGPPTNVGRLQGVACPTATSCFAVGDGLRAGTGYRAGIEHWNGTSWSLMKTPTVPANGPTLSGVSCPRPSSCFAVGGTAVLHWNGSVWSTMTVSHPGSFPSALHAVSCPSTTSCFAVGANAKTFDAAIAHWDGNAWSIMTSPQLQVGFGGLAAVSCPDASYCLAVGNTAGSGRFAGASPVAERWNGSQWSAIATPIHNGSHIEVADGVSCPGPSRCVVVGSSGLGQLVSPPAYLMSLVQSWDGKHWSLVTSPNPSGAADAHLNAVACPDPTSCFAVGESMTTDLRAHTLAERGPSTAATSPSNPIVGIAALPSGAGYWLVAADGGVFNIGAARFYGSTGAMRLNKPIVGMAATKSGNGYWLVASDGGIFTFGDAHFYGSTGSLDLNIPIVGIASSVVFRHYLLIASDGETFSF
jgi:hypothetical protein